MKERQINRDMERNLKEKEIRRKKDNRREREKKIA